MTNLTYSRDTYSQYELRHRWLEETIGKYNWGNVPRDDRVWSYTEAFGTFYYCFLNESDAMMYLLKWTGGQILKVKDTLVE